MKQPPASPQPSPQDNPLQDFEQQLLEVGRSLAALRQRYRQIKRDRHQQQQLQQQLTQLKQHKPLTAEMKAQLQQIQQQLEILEVSLESQLFSWRAFKDPFWQAVRFGGLGVIIGWILKSCAG
jgi:Lon protease-like protein